MDDYISIEEPTFVEVKEEGWEGEEKNDGFRVPILLNARGNVELFQDCGVPAAVGVESTLEHAVKNETLGDEISNTGMTDVNTDLETERKLRKDAEKKLADLVGFIAFEHGEFGKFLERLLSITQKGLEVKNVLTMGPFEDEKETDEFLANLTALYKQFLDDFEKLGETRDLWDRINVVLDCAASGAYSGDPQDIEVEDWDHIDDGCFGRDNDIRSPASTLVVETEAASSSSSSLSGSADVTLSPDPASASNVRKPGRYLKKGVGNAAKRHGVDYSKYHSGNFCLCGSELRCKTSLEWHINYFNSDWKFPCHICNRPFKFACQRRSHMILRHRIAEINGTKFHCSTCGKGFYNSKMMWRHKRLAHSGVSDRQETNQNAHINLFQPVGEFDSAPAFQGTDEAPQVSNPTGETEHGFDTQSNLHRCLCGKIYTQKPNLWSHIRAKLNGKIFKCGFCDKRFDQHSNLKSHIRLTHKMEYNQGKYGCSSCGLTFHEMNELIQHQIAAHGRNRVGGHILPGRASTCTSNELVQIVYPPVQEYQPSSSSPSSLDFSQPPAFNAHTEYNNAAIDDSDDEVICPGPKLEFSGPGREKLKWGPCEKINVHLDVF